MRINEIMFIKESGTQKGSMNVNSLLLSVNDERTRGSSKANLHLKEHTAKHDVSNPGLSKEHLHHLCVPSLCQDLLLACLSAN